MRFIRLIPAVLMLSMLASTANADVGEDFQKGGIALMGSGSFYYDLGRILDSANQYNYWKLSLAPEIDFLFEDNWTFYITPYLTYSSTQTDASNSSGYLYYGAEVGLSRYFVSDSKAQSGFVPAVGVAIGLEFDPGVGDKVAGVQTSTKSLYTYMDLVIPVRLFYFINDRLAPYVSIVPRLWYTIGAADSSGITIALTSQQRVFLDVGIYFGMSIWVPRNKTSLSGT
jgi:hypothetical protein